MGKSKFEVGDKVRYKGKIYTIDCVKYDIVYKRNVYTLKNWPKNWPYIYFVYSYQLEKVDTTLESDTINEKSNTSKTTVTLEFDKTTLNTIDPVNKFKNCANKVMVDGVVVKNRYGNVDENTRAFKLTLEEAQEMYNAGGKLREFALRVFTEDELKPKPKYPKTWDEYCDNFYPYEKHMHYVPQFAHGFSGEDADALIAFGRLIRLRRAWIGDWKPEMNDEVHYYCIILENKYNKYVVEAFSRYHHFLSFPTKEMAEDFMNCFKDLLNKAKTLI